MVLIKAPEITFPKNHKEDVAFSVFPFEKGKVKAAYP